MRHLLAASAAIALAACSGGEPTEAPAAENTVAAAPTIDPVTEGGYLVTAGTYETTGADGAVIARTLNGDGTYSRTSGTATETGTWKNEQGKTCFNPDGDDPAQPTRCSLVGSPAADGKITFTDEDGSSLVWTKTL